MFNNISRFGTAIWGTQSGPSNSSSPVSSPEKAVKVTDPDSMEALFKGVEQVEKSMGISPGFQVAKPEEVSGLYQLSKDAQENSMSLRELCQRVLRRGDDLIRVLNENIENQIGCGLPESFIRAGLGAAESIVQGHSVSGNLVADVYHLASRLAQNGYLEHVRPRPLELPNGFDLKSVTPEYLEYVIPQPKKIAEGIFYGVPAPKIDTQRLRENEKMAATLNTFAGNCHRSANDKISVVFNGKKYDELGTFLNAVRASGHKIEAHVQQRVANFLPLTAQNNDGEMRDVPCPVFLSTGLTDSRGHSLDVPATHAEWVFSIEPGRRVQGQAFSGQVRWFQGENKSTAFYPGEVMAARTWVGKKQTDNLSGVDAISAMELAARFGDAVNGIAKRDKLYNGGYGVTGVCQDSVSVIQQALTGRATVFPLLMDKKSVLPGIRLRARQASGAEREKWETLAKAVHDVPSDITVNSTTRERVESSIPYAKGKEPFTVLKRVREELKHPQGIERLERRQISSEDKNTRRFDLVNDKLPNAISLYDLVNTMTSNDSNSYAVARLSAGLRPVVGADNAYFLTQRALGAAQSAAELMHLSVGSMKVIVGCLNKAFQAGLLAEVSDKSADGDPSAFDADNGVYRLDAILSRNLPRYFDLVEAKTLDLEPLEPRLAELLPGIKVGYLPSGAPTETRKKNEIAAEIFDRLSSNLGQSQRKKFVVHRDGESFDSIEPFLKNLVADGHQLTAKISGHAAHATTVYAEKQNGEVLEVPLPILVDTGILDETGRVTSVPALHSALKISVKSNNKTKGTHFDGEVVWYTGLRGTHFYPGQSFAEPSWTGELVNADKFDNEDALQAVQLAGLFQEAINTYSVENKLWSNGYGSVGVCNDAVGIVQHALKGRTTLFPLFLDRNAVKKALYKCLSKSSGSERQGYETLFRSAEALPADDKPNQSRKRRILASLPYEPGEEPFVEAKRARTTLTRQSSLTRN